MSGVTTSIGNWTARLVAAALVVICLAVGAVGLILPIVPGLLFIAIALLLLAHFFPGIERRMRRSRVLASYLDAAAGFRSLSLGAKLRYGAWLCLRVLVDTVALLVWSVSKVLGFAVRHYQAYR